jgi:2-oxoglutarate ferredoxin oxidoreductase subunit beta
MIDVLQPCVSFNKVNTFAWYKKRCFELDEGYDPADWDGAMKTAAAWGDRIPVGVIYTNERPAYEERIPALTDGPLAGRDVDRRALAAVLDGFK